MPEVILSSPAALQSSSPGRNEPMSPASILSPTSIGSGAMNGSAGSVGGEAASELNELFFPEGINPIFSFSEARELRDLALSPECTMLFDITQYPLPCVDDGVYDFSYMLSDVRSQYLSCVFNTLLSWCLHAASTSASATALSVLSDQASEQKNGHGSRGNGDRCATVFSAFAIDCLCCRMLHLKSVCCGYP